MHNIFRYSLIVCILFSIFGIARADYQTYDEALVAARALFKAGDYEGAQRELEAGLPLAKTPDEKFSALQRLGETYRQRKLYPQAREQWGKIERLSGVTDDERASIFALIASTYGDEGDWDKAIDELKQALDLPDLTSQSEFGVRIVLCGAYSNSNQPDALERASEQVYAVIDSPKADVGQKAKFAIVFGDILITKSKFDQARAAYGEVDKLNGVSTLLRLQAMLKVAESYAKQNNPEASRVYTSAFIFGLTEGAKLSQGDKFEESNQVLLLSLTVPNLPLLEKNNALYYIGANYMELEQWPLAASYLRQAIVEPDAAELERIKKTSDSGLTFRTVRTSARVRLARLYAASDDERYRQAAVQLINELLQAPDATLNANSRAQLQQMLKSLPQPTP